MGITVDFEELFGVNAGYVEKVYTEYMVQPAATPIEWRRFFETHLEAHQLPKPAPASSRSPTAAATPVDVAADDVPLRGIAARIAENMAESLSVPTATSTRDVAVKVLEENRRIINEYLAAEVRGKASFTHLIAWALVRAVGDVRGMLHRYVERDGRGFRRTSDTINVGIAVDVEVEDGARQLVVPNVKGCESMNFATFMAAYDLQVHKARRGKLAPADFQDTTFTLTNPGTIGTVSSLPRLMSGQSFILATGAIGLPAAYQGSSPQVLRSHGVSKVLTLTSTYDHRVIQGADSGLLLARMHELLTGKHGFYEQVFGDLDIPYQPMQMETDVVAAVGSPQRRVQDLERAGRVMQYIRSYRVRGYLLANLDPLGVEAKRFPELEMSHYGLTLWDLDREFFSGGVTGAPLATLREIRDVLRRTYTRRIGVEYMHMVDPEQKAWLRERMESNQNEEELPRAACLRVLDQLVEAEVFERFLHTRFVGHKRFSLEGGESLVPVLDALWNRAGEHGIERGVIGIAHRGRLNVLAHVLDKPLTKIFSEFEGWIDPEAAQGSGDVKYHLGSTGVYRTANEQEIVLELASNPSHLEAVDPVVEGLARARQEQDGQSDARQRILPVLIHGDAAFAGQGVVSETLNMSQLHGYRTGGTVHIIVNNQIGYTTNPVDARSTPFCTDVAKAIQAPIFHVNGDDPLAAVRMVRLALDYRQRFERDVVLDIVCYRRHGHNEADEPAYTQPLLYERIEAHPSVRATYQDWLVRSGVIEPAEAEAFDAARQTRLRESLDEVRKSTPPRRPERTTPPSSEWTFPEPDLELERLLGLGHGLAQLPESFRAHPKIEKLFERKAQMLAGAYPVDFATAEGLAFASLVTAGRPVRLAGQDSGRGTFSQRHSVIVDVSSGETRIPLNFLAEEQARYSVVDSLLSEEAALGFEYGYSVATPDGLTMWEAQFGDFCNGAQIQIDQFLAAGESKWGQRCNLVLLLPHGHDGQGPEHSSARLERFLQLVAEDNLRIVNPSTAGQYHRLIRKQALDPERKPLIVMTPKSLLRQRDAGSQIEALATQPFAPVLADGVDPRAVTRVVLSSGKIGHELAAARDAAGKTDVALLRVEQLAPWPAGAIAAALQPFGDATTLVWCQEEPANMGAWDYVRNRLPFDAYAGREPAASPATGSLQIHKAEQSELVARALGD